MVADALQVARRGVVVHPDFAAGQMVLARAAIESSFKDEAKKALEAVVKITPENLEAQQLLAEICTEYGELNAARRCREIVSSLEPLSPEQVASLGITADQFTAEKGSGEEILELTEDLIETDGYGNVVAGIFSAEPERPSLGDAQHRAEPFLLEKAPPLYDQDKPAIAEQPVDVAEEKVAAPVASATIAELYVSQGFPEKGVEIYRAMLQDDPENETWKKRLAELTSSVPVNTLPEIAVKTTEFAGAGGGAPENILETLQDWLGNIGRIRECRTKSV
jgi:predicted Zn-dependent protease